MRKRLAMSKKAKAGVEVTVAFRILNTACWSEVYIQVFLLLIKSKIDHY